MVLRRAAAACAAAMCLGAAWAQESAPPGIANPGFEAGERGAPPPGWAVVPVTARAEVTDEDPIEGRACAVLFRANESDASFANLTQSIDAAPFRAKRVELVASVRTVGAGQAQVWMRVDRPGGAMGFFDNMDDRPIRSEAWASYSIRGDIDADAHQIAIGVFLLKGAGRAWIDGVSLRVIGEAGQGNIGPSPLTERGAANLSALARLFGVVRYFHPTTEVGAVDWDEFTIRAVRGVEGAGNDEELADLLNAWTAPIAPTVRVWAGPGEPVAARVPEGATHAAGMKYKGYSPPPRPGKPQVRESLYVSELVRESLPRDGSTREIQPPGTAVTVDLGGGVRARVPVTLYADSKRTLPAASGKEPDLPARPAGWWPDAGDRATRLAAVCLGWGALRHFYPYFDVVEGDWDAALEPALRKAAEDAGAPEFHRTLCLMLAHLHDGHGYVGGPGAPVRAPRDFAWTWAGEQLVVSAVDATQTLLKPGDVIVEVDGKSVGELYAEASPTICAATEGWRRARALNELGWAYGTGEVGLTVRRAGREMSVMLARQGASRLFTPPALENGAEVESGIVYFNLNQAETASLMAVWPKLLEAKGVIFDLRGYPGSAGSMLLPYLSDSPLKSASWNVPVLTMPDFERVKFETSNWNLPPQKPRLPGEVAFLTGGGAISYAESCMGIVEAYRLGEIVGAATAGSNGNVAVVKLPARYTLSFTGMKVLKHDGSRHHGVGIQPTVPVEPTVEGLAAGRDEVLDKAVEVLKAKIAADAAAAIEESEK